MERSGPVRNVPSSGRLALSMTGIFVLGLAQFGYALASSPHRPGATSPAGYYGWFDQGSYLREARWLANGDLPPTGDYRFGLGYPVAGMVGLKLGAHGDPFAIPDAIIFATTLALTVIVGARLRSLTFGVLAAAAVALATPLLPLTVLPWSSSITLLAVMTSLVVATAPGAISWRGAAILGLASGATFAARYVDFLFPAVIGGVALLKAREHWKLISIATLTAAVVVLPVLWTHQRAFGTPFETPYVSHIGVDRPDISDQDVSAYNVGKIPRSFVEVFVTGAGNGQPGGEPLATQFPWAAAAPLGVFFLYRARHPLRGPVTAVMMLSVLASAFYLSFRATTGANLKYFNLHYFKAWFPVWGLLAAYGLVTLAQPVLRSSPVSRLLASRRETWLALVRREAHRGRPPGP